MSAAVAVARLDEGAVRTAEAIERAAWVDLYAAAPRELGLSVASIDGATVLAAPRLPITLFNRVLGLGLDRAPGSDVLHAIDARYRAAGVARYWAHTTSLPAGAATARALEAHGFSRPPRGHWAKMLRGVEPSPEARTELAVSVARADERPTLARALVAAHGMPEAMAPWIEALADRPRWTAFAVRDDGSVIAGGLVYVDGRSAWLGLAGTLPAHRRRGAQGLLMRARIAHAAAEGASVVATETGAPIEGEHNPSLANMRRAGFTEVELRANHERQLALDTGR